jgi:hypothetical protein
MKTAVEFLVERLAENGILHSSDIHKAKEMEKQQIIKAVYDSMGTNLDPNMGRAEQYYNETYKSESYQKKMRDKVNYYKNKFKSE